MQSWNRHRNLTISALNSALNRWDACKARIWRAAGNDPMRGQVCARETYHTICICLDSIERNGYGADWAETDLELFVGRKLVAEAMEKADIVIRMQERAGVERAFRKELRDYARNLHQR